MKTKYKFLIDVYSINKKGDAKNVMVSAFREEPFPVPIRIPKRKNNPRFKHSQARLEVEVTAITKQGKIRKRRAAGVIPGAVACVFSGGKNGNGNWMVVDSIGPIIRLRRVYDGLQGLL